MGWRASLGCAVVALVAGCGSSVAPARDAGVAGEGGTCGAAALTCFDTTADAVGPLPAVKACGSDSDCVVQRFESDRSGTLEYVAVAEAGVAAFRSASMRCGASGGPPPGETFFEADGGTVPFGTADAGAIARCRAGCCIAVRP